MREYWLALRALAGRPSIVVFEDGTYAIRKGIIFKEFWDITANSKHVWWSRSDRHFEDCWTASFETIATAYATYYMPPAKPKGKGRLIALKF